MGLIDGLEHIIRENEPLAPYTWFRLGGPAQYFAEPTTLDELIEIVKRCRAEDVPVRLLGAGSNILIRDAGVPGMIVHLAAPAFSEISVEGQTVKAGGGAKLSHVVSSAVREGLAGLEQLVGLPGTVGAALHNNAGTKGGDIGQFTEAAVVLTRAGEVITRNRSDMRFSYLKSSLDELVILSAEFLLEKEDPATLTKRMQKIWILSRASQPLRTQNAGHIFKNEGGLSADDLIGQAGLNGARVGEAWLSEKHGNFIIADSDATASDVQRLIELIRSGVADRTGVELQLAIDVW